MPSADSYERAAASSRARDVERREVSQKRAIVASHRVANKPKRKSYRSSAAKNRSSGSSSRSYSAPIRSSSQGRYSRPSASVPTPKIAAAPKKPTTPTLEKFLAGDSGYQSQLLNFQKSLNDFLGEKKLRSGKLGTDYTESLGALQKQKGLDLEDIESDYGSRGLLRSGLYAEDVNKYNDEFTKRSGDLARARQQGTEELGLAEKRLRGEIATGTTTAKQQAARRRATKYSL